MSLSRQRCVRHPEREAAARCPACKRFFCRECVTEHEGRILCAACLSRQTEESEAASSPWLRTAFRATRTGIALAASFLFLWGFYTVIGAVLHAIPDKFHDSTAIENLRDSLE